MEVNSDGRTVHDPTYNKVARDDLRAKGKACSNCKHNNTKPGLKGCDLGNRAWPKGPCIQHQDGETAEALFVKPVNGNDKEDMLRLMNKAIQHVRDLSDLKSQIDSNGGDKLMNTLKRHIQGLLKIKPDMERERDNLLAEMNTERNRGQADQSD